MNVFVTGATGYLGAALCRGLQERGHAVIGLCSPASVRKLPAGVGVAPGDALKASSFERFLAPETTIVHLVGVLHPVYALLERLPSGLARCDSAL